MKQESESDDTSVTSTVPTSSDSSECDEQEQEEVVASEQKPSKETTELQQQQQQLQYLEEEEDIPDEFICPLTLELFNDPLMDRRGINFERSAIVEWLNRGHTTCPLTREPMGYRSLIPNANLRARVEHWKREHGYPVDISIYDDHDRVRERLEVVGTIEAPKDSDLELLWVRDLEQAENNVATTNTRRRRRRMRRLSLSGLTPQTQQRRLASLLGEALNISLGGGGGGGSIYRERPPAPPL
jgi:hypothetical protein